MSVSESLGSPVFHLQQVPTPPWAVGDQMFAPELLPEDHRLLNDQLSEIHVAAQEALRWAITEVKGNIWLDRVQSELRDAPGQYFVGRHFFDQDPAHPGCYLIEIECCFLRTGARGTPYVHPRYTVTLRWNAQQRAGTPQLARETERESRLARLTYRLVRTLRPQDIPGHDALTQAEQAFLESRWTEVLDSLQQAAREAVEDGSASGELDDEFFPSRLCLTGEYYIDSVSSSSDESFVLMLHFLQYAYFEGQSAFDYLGYDLDLHMTDGPLAYELWGHSSI